MGAVVAPGSPFVMPADAQTPFANLQKSKFSTTEPLKELNDIITYNNSCSISCAAEPASSSARKPRLERGRVGADDWIVCVFAAPRPMI